MKTNSNEFSAYSQEGQLLFREEAGVRTQYMYLGSKLVAKKKGGTVTYLHTDTLGSAVAETDASRALVGSRQYYKAFGDTVGTANDDVGYTGHKFDADLGLNYMQARYYDPVIGRFYSNDPVGTLGHLNGLQGIQGFNRFAYVNNNPFKYTDPNGMHAVDGACGPNVICLGESGSGESTQETVENFSVISSQFATGMQASLTGSAATFGQTSVTAEMRVYTSGWYAPNSSKMKFMAKFADVGKAFGATGAFIGVAFNGSVFMNPQSSTADKNEALILGVLSGAAYRSPIAAAILVGHGANELGFNDLVGEFIQTLSEAQGKAIRAHSPYKVY